MKEKLKLASLYLSVEQTLKLNTASQAEQHPKYKEEEYQKLVRAYEQYLGFSFFDDEDYPQSLKETKNPPYCIHYLGTISNMCSSVAVIGDFKTEDGKMNRAFNFALELLQNNVPLVCGTGKGIEKAIQECGTYTKTPIYAVESRGILSARSEFYTPVLLSGGAVIGTGDPYATWSAEGDDMKAYLIASLASALIILPTDSYYTVNEIVRSAMDMGKDVFVHRDAIDSKIGYRLARDGARIIDGVGHFLDYFNIDRSCMILPHKNGDIWFRKNQYKEFKLK